MVGSLKGRSSDIVQSRCTNPILKANKNQTMHSNGWSWSLSRRSPQKCSDAAASPSGWIEPSSCPFFRQNLKILTICFAMERGDCEFAKSSTQSVSVFGRQDKTRQDKTRGWKQWKEPARLDTKAPLSVLRTIFMHCSDSLVTVSCRHLDLFILNFADADEHSLALYHIQQCIMCSAHSKANDNVM